jgi:RNA polymerase sigma-70 factor (ECF subfamily)
MAPTRTNEQWLDDLRGTGAVQEDAINDLRTLLLRTVLFFFNRNLSDFRGLAHDEILQLAEDCAQEALISIMNHLSDFRGDSKFTTWAYKFAVNIALSTARRAHWKDFSLDQPPVDGQSEASEWIIQDKSSVVASDQSAMQSEVRQAIQEVIEHDLTENQRHVLLLMVFHEVPMDEVVRRLGTNRNAVYKLLHDARRKLKSSLQARGFEIGEMLALFSAQG